MVPERDGRYQLFWTDMEPIYLLSALTWITDLTKANDDKSKSELFLSWSPLNMTLKTTLFY